MITAIFLLVVLAGLAVAMVTMSVSQQTSSAMDVQGVRALQAARAGIEWGVYRQLRPTQAANCFADTSFALPAGDTLSGFTVSLQCSRVIGPGTLSTWTITSTACNQPAATEPRCPNPGNNADYVQRRLQAVLSN
ncbi:pilus assembly PilX N-terminal domain-containing protein [Janthinobacterium sp. RB2R34]|uniref:pilus assembly PilX N-terminal domain-containing protein n=1 Tax=Janthinobacterium sp. RB2R34 TaxID=3424193 RepID=UPI003F26356E